MSWFRQTRSNQFTDAESRAQLPGFNVSHGQLCKVVEYTPLAGPYPHRFLYTVTLQVLRDATDYYRPTDAQTTEQMQALSVSELSNSANGYVSYGVLYTNIPAGFEPKPIPSGTWVWCVPHRMKDGAFIWLIVNTQAIDGVC